METINTDVFQAIIDFELSKLNPINFEEIHEDKVNNNLRQGKIFYFDYDSAGSI